MAATWVLGVMLNLAGSLSINLGTNIIKLGHSRAEVGSLEEPWAGTDPPRLLRAPRAWWGFPGSRTWAAGMALFLGGNALNFASFGFAAQSLLAALGSIQFVSNVVFARYVNKESIPVRVLLGTAIIVAGCVVLVSFGNHESPTLTADQLLDFYSAPGYIVYLSVMFPASVAFYLMYAHGKHVAGGITHQLRGPWARRLPLCYALFSGMPGTQSVLYGKSISLLLRTTFGGNSQLGSWYLYFCLVLFLGFAGFWLTRFSKGVRLFPVVIIMPILQVVWVLFTMGSGLVYFQEYRDMSALQGGLFGLGAAVLLAGVWAVASCMGDYFQAEEEPLPEGPPGERPMMEGLQRLHQTPSQRMLARLGARRPPRPLEEGLAVLADRRSPRPPPRVGGAAADGSPPATPFAAAGAAAFELGAAPHKAGDAPAGRTASGSVRKAGGACRACPYPESRPESRPAHRRNALLAARPRPSAQGVRRLARDLGIDAGLAVQQALGVSRSNRALPALSPFAVPVIGAPPPGRTTGPAGAGGRCPGALRSRSVVLGALAPGSAASSRAASAPAVETAGGRPRHRQQRSWSAGELERVGRSVRGSPAQEGPLDP